jgi:peptidoglycan hydrolase CwlO-like protein
MVQQSDSTALAIAAMSAFTVLVAWVFRYKIAELARRKTKAPQEVLFEGYEKLLKSYQSAISDRDNKIAELEANFDKMQADLDAARNTINELKTQDAKKTRIISELELRLSELKTLHQQT